MKKFFCEKNRILMPGWPHKPAINFSGHSVLTLAGLALAKQ